MEVQPATKNGMAVGLTRRMINYHLLRGNLRIDQAGIVDEDTRPSNPN
jgi:hypothetical protein